jgi:hypothetical protein
VVLAVIGTAVWLYQKRRQREEELGGSRNKTPFEKWTSVYENSLPKDIERRLVTNAKLSREVASALNVTENPILGSDVFKDIVMQLGSAASSLSSSTGIRGEHGVADRGDYHPSYFSNDEAMDMGSIYEQHTSVGGINVDLVVSMPPTSATVEGSDVRLNVAGYPSSQSMLSSDTEGPSVASAKERRHRRKSSVLRSSSSKTHGSRRGSSSAGSTPSSAPIEEV